MPLDDRLSTELRRLAPSDPSGAFERVVEKRVRRRIARRMQSVALVVIVLVGTSAGFYGLSRVFLVDDRGPATPPVISDGAIAYFTFVDPEDPSAGTQIRTFEPRTGENRVLITLDGYPPDHLEWSPDGTRLMYGGDGVSILDVSTGRTTTVTQPTAFGPSWSPDGSQIAYAVDLEGHDVIEIANADAKYDAALKTYDWTVCRCLLKIGARGDAYANLVTVNRGRTGGWKWDNDRIVLKIEDQASAEE